MNLKKAVKKLVCYMSGHRVAYGYCRSCDGTRELQTRSCPRCGKTETLMERNGEMVTIYTGGGQK